MKRAPRNPRRSFQNVIGLIFALTLILGGFVGTMFSFATQARPSMIIAYAACGLAGVWLIATLVGPILKEQHAPTWVLLTLTVAMTILTSLATLDFRGIHQMLFPVLIGFAVVTFQWWVATRWPVTR